MRAAQKLETVGQLTAGIAHNFNNMLMGLIPNLELAAKRAPEDLAPLLRDAERSAQRAADVVRQLMTYAGSNRGVARRVEPLGELASRTALFSRTTFGPRICIEVQVHGDPAASVDASQIEQAVLNLLINARDALSHPSVVAPTIAVTVGAVAEGAPELEGRKGDWVYVRVDDNGVGMTHATLQRMYDPFFTTKEAGKGTGLGLATTHGIVRDHGGFIACRSEPGGGTSFSLYLPGAAREGVALDATPEARSPRPESPRPRRTILVVDDDAAVRRVIALLLEDGGFDAKTAASGDAALRLLAERGERERIELILLDVSMPGMPGPVLRGRLREIAPEVPVVYLTGHAYEGSTGDVVLHKPLSGSQLVAAVDAAQAGARTTSKS
jgi:CheY-like chemotaxis protein